MALTVEVKRLKEDGLFSGSGMFNSGDCKEPCSSHNSSIGWLSCHSVVAVASGKMKRGIGT